MRAPKNESGPVVMVSIMGFSTDYPLANFTVRKDAQLLSDHPVVQAHSANFVPLGTPEGDIQRILSERDAAWRDEMLKAAEASKPRRVRARVGFVLNQDHPLVRAFPDFFEPLEPAEGANK